VRLTTHGITSALGPSRHACISSRTGSAVRLLAEVVVEEHAFALAHGEAGETRTLVGELSRRRLEASVFGHVAEPRAEVRARLRGEREPRARLAPHIAILVKCTTICRAR